MEYIKARNEAKRRDKILHISRPGMRQKGDRKYQIYQGQERSKKKKENMK